MGTTGTMAREMHEAPGRAIAILFLSLAAADCGGAAPAPTRAREPEREAAAPPPVRPLTEEEAARTYTEAMQVHVRAREQQAQCDEGDMGACVRAAQLFELADDTWRALVEGRPNDLEPEWLFMLAQARFHAGRFERAAEAAERYLETGASEWRVAAARLLVAARQRVLQESGIRAREAPPQAEGTPPAVRPIELPPPIAALSRAREVLAQALGEAGDPEREARSLSLENALVLVRYGHFERAQEGLRAIVEQGCSGEGAWEGAAVAWRALHDMAAALERYDALRALGQQIESQNCDFGLGAPACVEGSDHPRCIARTDRALWALRGGTRYLELADHARGRDAARFALRAAEAFLAALDVEGELDAHGRVTALVQAEAAFRRAGAAERAAEVDARIVREVRPEAFDEADRPMARSAVAAALGRRLEAAVAAGRHEDVVTLARRLLAPDLDLPELASRRHGARAALPEALLALGRNAEASRAFAQLASASEDPALRREAELRSALALVTERSCGRAVRPLRAFVAAHGEEEAAADAVVRALWQLAACQRAGSAQHAAVLEEVVRAGARGELGREARERVAEAAFLLADRGFADATNVRLHVPAGENIEDLADGLRAALEQPLERVRALLSGYASVERHGVGRWIVAARQRSGAALEALDRAVLAASWELPRDLTSQRNRLNRPTLAQIQRITEMRAGEILRAQAVAIRCRAAAHYRRALEIAGTAGVDSEESRAARERLEAMELPDRCPR